ncbi:MULTISPECIES: peptidoglycan-binding protein [unclassified Streptococcus]|uniref:peptidoglycan-binding protein n=1 Tax=unclassified Streptococcus TaxID=2608887 RepID=UPI0010720B02|nr:MULTISPECIES: peptidoglycan-binding protein [unclassified Streptococcus]MBF0806591.1 peptidoglycan-binding protein [Streptococcus sp. 19428wA2_WM07]TFU27348.1 peptidoglycan-binding protein [Streptococcus sp. WM07]
MRKDQKQKYRNFGILSAASALVIGGTVLAENYTGSQETTSSTIKKTETAASSSSVRKSTFSDKKAASREENNEVTTEKVGELSEFTEEGMGVQAQASTPASRQEAIEVISLSNTAETYTYAAPVSLPAAQGNYSNTVAGSAVLANGNTAGEHGIYAAARMAELTGVSASTWENIIARESNGNIYAANASGASGLFQTMPGWGSTASVDDQIQAAYNAYSNQGLAAWGY